VSSNLIARSNFFPICLRMRSVASGAVETSIAEAFGLGWDAPGPKGPE